MALWIRILIGLGLVGGLLFASAGGFHFVSIWAYLALLCGFAVLFLLTADREVQRERLGPGTPGQGRYFRAFLLPFAAAHVIVAGLDVGRFGWSRRVPSAIRCAGFIGLALALLCVWWAMWANRFFTPAILVQSERGHHVVSTGPYRLVRHPGYLGMAVGIVSSGLALGSYWSLLPAAAYGALLIGRTAREDRLLQERLTGYAQYARRVRSRLLPGVW